MRSPIRLCRLHERYSVKKLKTEQAQIRIQIIAKRARCYLRTHRREQCHEKNFQQRIKHNVRILMEDKCTAIIYSDRQIQYIVRILTKDSFTVNLWSKDIFTIRIMMIRRLDIEDMKDDFSCTVMEKEGIKWDYNTKSSSLPGSTEAPSQDLPKKIVDTVMVLRRESRTSQESQSLPITRLRYSRKITCPRKSTAHTRLEEH